MKDIREMNILKTIALITFFALSSCSREKVEIVSWSPETKELILKSSVDLELSDLIVRQGETQKIFFLTGQSLKAGVAKTFVAPNSFLNKRKNSLALIRLTEIDKKEDFDRVEK